LVSRFNSGKLAATLAVTLALTSAPPAASAEEHVVPLTELSGRLAQSAAERDANRRSVARLFSSPEAAGALKNAGIDRATVDAAIALLSEAELARLASRAARLEADVAAGALNNQQLTYVIIALATALIVTIIFVA